MKYDDASWHCDGDFPKSLPESAAATHIGLYLAWCLLNELGSSLHSKDQSPEINQLLDKEVSPGQWCIEHCDGQFTDEDLDEIGNQFTRFYYAKDSAPFYTAYESALAQSLENLYEVPDTWESYERLAPLISKDFHAWRANG